ncbi:BCCT family transporter [Vibrio parahaemolyticus]|uniref:Glycine betaine/proline/choline transporter VP1723 n=9 Tax=Vibrionaceae TaxID=641 RepID=BCCT2_VIBPA|nr:BCCT family transporter [Vibrio parahaemolyticus]Q87NZ5.1 RecName: Full=Glycine betaine/proline/choline transporter VP1723 [Vibrio parahaemolyticus RIMD 2210633]EFO35708.1 transporter, bcct family [Vibrio parahaemolyticus Peru-466]EFO49143.1 transporter, bcct family [Vibrio parahaemolyticus K5030]ARC17085.1 BCCT family transporter [Vibrio parahaemolyticus]AZV70779.1 BCCT family transporter [Vibrio parahaemolyticus]EFO42945.1 transporter, bcct family [Vibrio parahaemolyticus AN-5034]
MSTDNNGGIKRPDGKVNAIDTDYQIGQDNVALKVGPFGLDIHNRVFAISGMAIVLFVVATLTFRQQVEPFFAGLRAWLVSNLDWFFLASGNVFVIVCLVLIVTPLGRVRIGGTEATPDYSYAGWLAMLFAAGMGIGLVFFGVSEPMSHFSSALGGVNIENGVRTDWAPLGGAVGDTDAASALGMAATIYHWALHPWSIYALLALGLAIFSFNKGLPLTMRSIFYPLFGERVWGWVGHIIDILAVVATVFGLATSLGYGASQAATGLNFLFGVPMTDTTQVVLIVVITALALISVVAGLDSGVKRLSEINMILAAMLLFFVIIVGPTMAILTGFFDNIASYITNIPALSMPFEREDVNYSQGWTAFYWAWWISWSPFVGMFIARVSRGRSVREFIICVILIPSTVCVLWMTAFGGTAISQYVNDGYEAVFNAELPLKLFAMLDVMPFAEITSVVGIILVVVFFITSSDSGSLVIDTIAAGGKVDAPTPQRVFWCTFEGLVAIALMLGGGLAAAQAMAVTTGLPFTIVLLVATVSLIKGLMDEPRLSTKAVKKDK